MRIVTVASIALMTLVSLAARTLSGSDAVSALATFGLATVGAWVGVLVIARRIDRLDPRAGGREAPAMPTARVIDPGRS